MILLLLVLIFDFCISWGNAYYCGRYWSESKVEGGFFRVNVIAGYIMAIAGFTMVYGYIILLLLPQILPMVMNVSEIQMEQIVGLTNDLMYVLIVMAIIPSGFFIWFNSIKRFWERKNFRNGIVAGYNTVAQIHNIVSASRELPNAFARITKTLFGGKNSKKANEMVIAIAIFVIIIAIFGGYFTASTIMKKADREYDAFKLKS